MSAKCDGARAAKFRAATPGEISRLAAAKARGVRSLFLPSLSLVVVVVIIVVFIVGGVESVKYADLLKCWDADHWSYVPLPKDGVNSTKAQEEFDERNPFDGPRGNVPWREWDCLENQVVIAVITIAFVVVIVIVIVILVVIVIFIAIVSIKLLYKKARTSVCWSVRPFVIRSDMRPCIRPGFQLFKI